MLALPLAGFALPFLAVWITALALSVPPLSLGERYAILNTQFLPSDDYDFFCHYGRPRVRRGREIAVFGGSTAQGAFVEPGAGFAEVLYRGLEARFPGTWAVHNFAVSGKGSHFLVDCMRATPYGPVTWIVYEGHNDFANLYRGGIDRNLFFLQHSRLTKLFDELLQLRAAGLLRHTIRVPEQPNLDQAAHFRLQERILEISRANHLEMIRIAREKGARLVFLTVVRNYSAPPSRSVRTSAPSDKDAAALHREGLALQAAGRHDDAMRALLLAGDLDGYPSAAPTSYNQMLRGLAKENPEVALIDLEKDFQAEFKREGIDCKLFATDAPNHCSSLHPNARLHAWIGEKIERALFPPGTSGR